MKKLLCVSGALTALLLCLVLTGWADMDDAAKEALRQGNQRYAAGEYEAALKHYEEGLAASPNHQALNFNAGQAAYLLGEYEKAIAYYASAGDQKDAFLNAGNICFRAGDAAQDANEKVQLYGQALQAYMAGIAKYPQEIPLKYNFELVKEKLEEMAQQSEQEDSSEGQGEESEDSESGQGDEEQDAGQGENSTGEQDSGQEDQSDEEKDSGQGEGSEEEQDQQQDGDEQQDGQEQQQGSYAQGEEGDAPDQEAVERILQMLESQEEESLKNNREVVGGNEGKYDW